MHRRTIAEPEMQRRQRTLHDAIGSRRVSDRAASDARLPSASPDSVLGVAHRGYYATAQTNQKLFDIAARCSMRNITIGKIRIANHSPNAFRRSYR
jgi:hypothetical protein